jgi:Cdc6-like AAA superfamily ATPase
MGIDGCSEREFRKKVADYLTPARAITSPEHLKGREQKLTQIDRAFNSPGKHVFIYGDRGVGKTSLAQTAAFIQQSSDAEPIRVACGDSDFFQTIRDAVSQALPIGNSKERRTEEKLKLGVGGFGYELGKTIVQGAVPSVSNVNEAANLLQFVAHVCSREPVIIFDEFDQIQSDADKKKCADTIKQVSDRGINVRFIICGIGSSLEELIGVHLSTGRYLSPIQLEPLSHDACWQIIQSVCTELGLRVQHSHLVRISQISDGFPYYVHLIGEQMLWSAFDDPHVVSTIGQDHFEKGVKQAVQEAQTTLRIIYEKATQKYSDIVYEEVLWAVADGHLLRRQISSIFVDSYLKIMADRHPRPSMTKKQFYNRMNSLKTEHYGSILTAKGAGWYEFTENIVRGYVRLKAESEGVQLGREGFN